jgi:hypothetical protein
MKLLRLEKTTLLTRKSINRSPLSSSLFLAILALACPALSPVTQAVTPPPVGGYSGQNTATGDYALFNLTTGTRNTAIGFQALNTNTTGGKNTAIGFFALQDNPTGKNNIALGYRPVFSLLAITTLISATLAPKRRIPSASAR